MDQKTSKLLGDIAHQMYQVYGCRTALDEATNKLEAAIAALDRHLSGGEGVLTETVCEEAPAA